MDSSLPRATLASAVAMAAPALLIDPPWPPPHAAAQWTPDTLPRMLDPVRIVPHGVPVTIQSWNVDQALAAHNAQTPGGFEALPHDPTVRVQPMGTATFFSEPSAARHYYAGALLDEDGEPPRSLAPLKPLVDVLHNASGRSVTLKAWLGTTGATTPLHYDTLHNAYAQLHGEKSFTLHPPEALETRLRLFPRIHPLSHFSRLVGGQGDENSPDALPAEPSTARALRQVRLTAGDVLYLPPFWAHAAVCERQCVAANVWVSSEAMHANDAVERLPLPFEAHWSDALKARAALSYLRWLLVGSTRAAGAVGTRRCSSIEQLLASRWHDAPTLFGSRRGEAAEARRVAESAVCEPTRADNLTDDELGKLQSYAEQRAVALAGIDERIRPTLLADQLERVAHWATGGAAIATHALLVRLSACCASAALGTALRSQASLRDEL
jgi:hypothetical protein